MTERSGLLLESFRRWCLPIDLMALGTAGCLILSLFCSGAEQLMRVAVPEIVGEVAASELVFPATRRNHHPVSNAGCRDPEYSRL